MRKSLFAIGALALCASCSSELEFDASGLFEATTVTVSSETAGRIVAFEVTEGQEVSNGQTVCLIDSTAFILQRTVLEQQQRALLAGKPDIEKQIASLKVQIAKQKSEQARVAALLRDDAATQKQMDDVNAQLAFLQKQYDATLSSLSSSSASIDGNIAVIASQIDQAEYSLSKCTVTSPLDGVVLAKYAQEGELAVAGKPLFKVGDLRDMYLRAYFTSEQMADITQGQKVKVVADFGGGLRYEYLGTIIWIASEHEFTPKYIQTKTSRANLVYAVKIAVKNDGRLKIGLYGEVIL